VQSRLLRKLAGLMLRAAGGRLRRKKLEKRVLDAAGIPRGGAQRREARAALALAMQAKRNFGVEGHDIVLVA
jgi:hypothetical protein